MVYFKRYAYPKRFLEKAANENTFISVVIPVYNEPQVLLAIKSLYKCNLPACGIEILVVLNHSETDSEEVKAQSEHSFQEITDYIQRNKKERLTTHIIKAYDLPLKKAGVGLARKIGMDEAAYRFNQINKEGVIACFDADSLCEPNYLHVLEKAFSDPYSKINAASIHFEHPLKQEEKINWPIVYYELHLRYYIQSLAYANYPFAFHTIGSSMVVNSTVYQNVGRMNTRKAGEDFYFLHKIMPLGNFCSITDTVITPSARESDRVPFGTGKAIKSHKNNEKLLGYTYDFTIFEELRQFFKVINEDTKIENLSTPIATFLLEEKLENELQRIQKNAKNSSHFRDRFFQWFNGFKVLKCVHYLRNHFFTDLPIEEAVDRLITSDPRMKLSVQTINSLEYLYYLREFEQRLDYRI